MKVLRHEEFEEGCKASCNGPYDGRWSKTMVGYGPEDGHFVMELTYNYGIKSYQKGNDYQGITINSSSAFEKDDSNSEVVMEAPGGYPFRLVKEVLKGRDPVQKITLGVSEIQRSLDYWNKLLSMKIYGQTVNTVLLGYSDEQCKLELVQLEERVDHAEAFGRIAFSCPNSELVDIESSVKSAGHLILTPLVSLDTPGKATVQVVILADPDGHEICFVGDEGFRELSQVDPKADELLTKAMEEDKSTEWFEKKKNKEK